MGQIGTAPSTIPSRPKFAWDAKTPPWTDGKGNQERFKVAVEDWVDFHNALPENIPNKMAKEVQGIVLKSQLFGQAADKCSELTREQLRSNDGVNLIVNAVYRRDFMSVISEAYDGCSTLINTKRGSNESLKGFETRFYAAVNKFNSFSTTSKLPQCITALLLLNNSSIEHSQRVSALSAAAFSGTVFSDQASNDEFLKVVTYSQVSSFVKQCEKAHSTNLSASNAGTSTSPDNSRGPKRPYIGALKRYPCRQCKKFGHWKSSHRQDGSLLPNVKSFDTSEEFIGSLGKHTSKIGDKKQDNNNKTISFNMARLSNYLDNNKEEEVSIGPLVDDAAEYSTTGSVELKIYFDMDIDDNLDQLPSTLNGHTHWQYGQGEHASQPRPMLGSIVLSVQTDTGTTVNIRHVVVEGSSQWVIGRNVTSLNNIIHIDRNAIELKNNNQYEYISLMDKKRLSYIPLSSFNIAEQSQSLNCLTASLSTTNPGKK